MLLLLVWGLHILSVAAVTKIHKSRAGYDYYEYYDTYDGKDVQDEYSDYKIIVQNDDSPTSSRVDATKNDSGKEEEQIVILQHPDKKFDNALNDIHYKDGVFLVYHDCDFPKNIPNGITTHTGIVVNSTTTYSCHKGFILKGQRFRKCTKTGGWDGKEPTCVKAKDQIVTMNVWTALAFIIAKIFLQN